MQLLSDTHAVGSRHNTDDGTGGPCYLFPSQEALDASMLLLSATSWDAPNKEELAAARAEITQLAGFQEVADALLAACKQSSTSAGGDLVQPEDELDSYEALVRDAGKYGTCSALSLQCIKNNLLIYTFVGY